MSIYEFETPRLKDVYGVTQADYLYCFKPTSDPTYPAIVSESDWCHEYNYAWYSVVDPMHIHDDMLHIETEKKWNNLAGYLILGNASLVIEQTKPTHTVCGELVPHILGPSSDGRTASTEATILRGSSVRFTGSASKAYGGVCPVITYEWHFPDKILFGRTPSYTPTTFCTGGCDAVS